MTLRKRKFRTITIELADTVDPDVYNELAQLIWLQTYLTAKAAGVEYYVKPDDKASEKELNGLWESYGNRWEWG